MAIFSDIKVIELASVLAGPSVGQFFAELGAQVIKLENLRSGGDVTRSWILEKESSEENVTAYFSSVNWGKKSMALDITKPEGLNIIYELIKKADILIVSYKPGDAEKLLLDYQRVVKLNPGIIYGHITGYGPDNPKVGYDAIIQAEAGFIAINGEPGGNPLKMPVALMDILAAHHLKEGILLAMLQQAKTGKGSYVSVSLIQAAIASLANQASNWLVGGMIPKPMGTEHPNIAPYGNIFETADGKRIILAVGNDKQFDSLCAILSLVGWSDDTRFQTNESRVRHRKILSDILNKKISEWQCQPLLKALETKRVPAGIVKNIQEVFESLEARDLLLRHGNFRGVKTFAAHDSHSGDSIKLSAPPKLGEHTREILSGWLAMQPDKIEQLAGERVVL